MVWKLLSVKLSEKNIHLFTHQLHYVNHIQSVGLRVCCPPSLLAIPSFHHRWLRGILPKVKVHPNNTCLYQAP